jgi:hypothetical protein
MNLAVGFNPRIGWHRGSVAAATIAPSGVNSFAANAARPISNEFRGLKPTAKVIAAAIAAEAENAPFLEKIALVHFLLTTVIVTSAGYCFE